MIVPDHLSGDGTKQRDLIIRFDEGLSSDEVLVALRESGISWDSIDWNERIIWGGPVFRIQGRSGFWVLNGPCLYCYRDIAEECGDDLDTLLRCFMRARL